MIPTNVDIRALTESDAVGWVRCRALSFLGSAYFDDVRQAPTTFENPAIRLVAISNPPMDAVVGLIDVELVDQLATIDSIAVHPDHQGSGIATALLAGVRAELPPHITELDAWTREDPPANAWYQAMGFAAEQHYLHVYKTWDSETDEELAAPAGLRIVGAFMHASLDDEDDLRRRFNRVHVCRRYVQTI